MGLKFLNPNITQKLLENQKDILTPMHEIEEKYYADQTCPQCGGHCRKTGNTPQLFNNNEHVFPRYLLECLACGSEFDPRTRITVTLGNKAKAVEPVIPILKGPKPHPEQE